MNAVRNTCLIALRIGMDLIPLMATFPLLSILYVFDSVMTEATRLIVYGTVHISPVLFWTA